MTRVAVTSKSFSKNLFLREQILKRFTDTKFNDAQIQFDCESLIDFLQGVERAIIALETINEDVLSALPNLKVISKYGVGIDKIDMQAMHRHNVNLGWAAGVNKRSVTELVVGQMIAVLRHLYSSNADVKNGVWQVWAKPLVGGATAALLLNRNATGTVNITLSFASCNISSKATVLTDLWSGEMLSSSSRKAWSAEVQPHSHRFVRIAPPGRNF